MSALASCVFFRVREVLVLSPRGRKEGEERVGGKAGLMHSENNSKRRENIEPNLLVGG